MMASPSVVEAELGLQPVPIPEYERCIVWGIHARTARAAFTPIG